ncbi:MAG: oligosaccharide flippase family protein [Planctomycetes bacterium]|nr:oligosaccharide flippase family protein [Planctomycetota bacterium]
MSDKLGRLAGQSFLYLAGNVASKLLALLLLPLFTRYLAPADYGVTGLLLTVSVVVGSLAEAGVPSAAALYYHDGSPALARPCLLGTAQAWQATVPLALCALLTWLAAPLSELLFRTPAHAALVVLTLGATYARSLAAVPLLALRMEGRARAYAALTTTHLALGLAASLFLVAVAGRGLRGYLEGQLLAAAAQAAAALLLGLRGAGLRVSGECLRLLVGKGWPYVLMPASFWVLAYSDRYFLERTWGIGEVGLYSLAGSVAAAVSLGVDAFGAAWPPYLLARAREPGAARAFARVFTYYAAAALGAVLALSAVGRELFRVLTQPPFWGAAAVVPWLALAYALKGAYLVAIAGIYVERRPVRQAGIEAAGAATALGLNFLLISRFGRIGAGLASVGTHLVLVALAVVACRSLLALPYERARVAGLVAAFALGLGLCLGVDAAPALPPLAGVAAKLGAVAAFVCALLPLGIAGPEERAWLRSRLMRLGRASTEPRA